MFMQPSLLILNIIPFVLSQYSKPLAEKVWRQRCMRNNIVMNDCNLCRCSSNFRYECDARVCAFVDVFGHFKDAIQDIKVGMEGHGVWRSGTRACEPGVHYQISELLCVCNLDGTWPSPVCRDTLQVLHSVEVIPNFKASPSQRCTPESLYVVDCNVCICPQSGYVDLQKCTQRNCTIETEIEPKRELRTVDIQEINEIYAQCSPDQTYKLGCRNCRCLRNNRLICNRCNELEPKHCENKAFGETFWVDCNICHCGENGMVFCTVYNCQGDADEESSTKFSTALKPFSDLDCQPGTRYRKDCNMCYCFQNRMYGSIVIKKFACTVEQCAGQDQPDDCEIGERYEKPCLLCRCGLVRGEKMEICESDPLCGPDKMKKDTLKHSYSDPNEIITFRQDCHPMKVYQEGCTSCLCLPDGKTLSCIQGQCKNPISLDVIPVNKKLPNCIKGQAYKIDCNYCVCLPNGDALCSTIDCDTKVINKY